MTHTHTDCRAEDGITVGLLDALIAISRVLAVRDLGSPAAQEAVRDLASDADFRAVVRAAFRP